jgi:hypothetical protein
MRLARSRPGESGSPDREAILRDLEWLAGADDGGLHNLLPLVMRGVFQMGLRGHLSEHSRRRLEAGRLQQIAAVDRHCTWLAQLESSLSKKDLRIVLLKGAAFTGTVYPHDTPRGAADIDFLVKKGDFEKMCRMLAWDATHQSDWSTRKVSFRVDYERGFLFGESVPFLVEVHRGLTNPVIFSIDESGLWRHSVPHPDFESGRVRMLSTEDNILHLAVHGYRHLDVMNHNLLDVHELISGHDPNWHVLVQRAEVWKARGALHMLLRATAQALETPVPTDVILALQPRKASQMAANAVYRYKKEHRLRHGQVSYRVVQLLGQLCVPDSFLRAVTFQGYYGALRFFDFVDFVKRRYLGDNEMG